MKASPDFISSLKEDEIFVFGSNLSGIHGAGAAKQALKWGARWGQSFGRQGQTYAIPTKDQTVYRSLTSNEIFPFVKEFTEYAKHNPQLNFLVTEIGCGLAGNSPKEIAPLFKEAFLLENVFLPKRFVQIILPKPEKLNLKETNVVLEYINGNLNPEGKTSFLVEIEKQQEKREIKIELIKEPSQGMK